MSARAGLSLRHAAAADLPALAALYAHCARTLGPQVYSSEQVAAWQSFAQDGEAFADYVLRAETWLAEDDAGPLGFCRIESDGEVRSLYVRAAATRKGVGAALLAHALAQARSNGIERFAAWATPFSLPVFGRAGFALVRTVREPFQGVVFERYRVALGPSADDA
jgi:putative acetyltransferase